MFWHYKLCGLWINFTFDWQASSKNLSWTFIMYSISHDSINFLARIEHSKADMSSMITTSRILPVWAESIRRASSSMSLRLFPIINPFSKISIQHIWNAHIQKFQPLDAVSIARQLLYSRILDSIFSIYKTCFFCRLIKVFRHKKIDNHFHAVESFLELLSIPYVVE